MPHYTLRQARIVAEHRRCAEEISRLLWEWKAGFKPDQPRVPRGQTDGGQWTRVGPSGETIPKTWSKPETFSRHVSDHMRGVGASSPDEYARMAREFLLRGKDQKLPAILTREGYLKLYDPATREFGVYAPGGRTESFYKAPRPQYFNNQIEDALRRGGTLMNMDGIPEVGRTTGQFPGRGTPVDIPMGGGGGAFNDPIDPLDETER